jgi:hypothetical protein
MLYFSGMVIDDDVLRFYIAVHDTLGVGIVQSFENLVNIVLAITGRDDA